MSQFVAKRVAWFVALIASSLAACGGNTKTDTSGGGASSTTETGGGGQSSTSATGATAGVGGTGGTTGTGATGGAVGGSSGSYCELACDLYDGQCVNGDCVITTETLFVSAVEMSQSSPNNPGMDMPYAYALLFPAGTTFEGPTVLGAQGPCQALAFSNTAIQPPVFDAGTITVQGPNLPATNLSPMSGYYQSFMSSNVFSPGDVLQFTVAGGPDFPGFGAQVTAPAELAVVLPQVQQSQPLTISWNPPEPPLYVYLITGNGMKAIFCTPVAPGSVLIPASLLSLLDPPSNGSTATVFVPRINVASAIVPGAQARVSAMKFIMVGANYVP